MATAPSNHTRPTGLDEATKALEAWLKSGGALPVEQTDGGSSTGQVEVGDFTFSANPSFYGGGYQVQHGNTTHAFDPRLNLQQSYTQDGETVNTYDPQGNLIRSYTPQTGFGNFLKKVAPIALSVFGAPALAGAFGGGLGATVGAGAITGAAGSAITGGNILKGAALGGIGGGIGYGINNSGLLDGIGSPTGTGTLPTDLGLQPLTPINPVEITLQDLPMPGISAPSIPSPIDLGSGLQSLPVPGYNFSSPNFDMPDPGLVNNPITNTPVGGYTTPAGVAPGSVSSLLDAANNPSIIDQARAAGKSVQEWLRDNPLAGRALMSAGGALLNTIGGPSSSGGSSYRDDGYRPTISRGGWQPRIAATQVPTPQRPPMGLISLPTTGQANDGLWRYGLLGPGR